MFDFFRPVPNINIKELESILQNDIVLLDVRTVEEYVEGHIKGAKNVPLEQIETFNEDKNKKIYIICRSGRRSKIATKYLNKKGYETYNIIGGMLEWKGDIEKNI